MADMRTQLTILSSRAQAIASDLRMLKSEAQDRDLPSIYGLIEDAEDAVDESVRKMNGAAMSLSASSDQVPQCRHCGEDMGHQNPCPSCNGLN